MAHETSRCDFIDVLEESAVARTTVRIETVGGKGFSDVVSAVVTENGEDYAEFRDHGRIAVSDIRTAARATPLTTSYDSVLPGGR